MNPVRPSVYPPMQPAAQGAGAVKTAAQRAFFDQALGKATGAPQQTQAPATPARAASVQTQAQAVPPPVQRMPTAQPTEAPTRILRPGSLLDIRV